jgi:hypothetical protein
MVFLEVGVGDRPAIGVRVDQQDLAARGRGLEGEIDGHGRPARRSLRAPDGGQDVPRVALGLGHDLIRRRRCFLVW